MINGYGAWLCDRLTYLKERLALYGTAISPTLLQLKELRGNVETKFSFMAVLVVPGRKERSNDNGMTHLKVRLIDVRVKLLPLCYSCL